MKKLLLVSAALAMSATPVLADTIANGGSELLSHRYKPTSDIHEPAYSGTHTFSRWIGPQKSYRSKEQLRKSGHYREFDRIYKSRNQGMADRP